MMIDLLDSGHVVIPRLDGFTWLCGPHAERRDEVMLKHWDTKDHCYSKALKAITSSVEAMLKMLLQCKHHQSCLHLHSNPSTCCFYIPTAFLGLQRCPLRCLISAYGNFSYGITWLNCIRKNTVYKMIKLTRVLGVLKLACGYLFFSTTPLDHLHRSTLEKWKYGS